MEIKCIKLNEMIECVCQSNLKVKYLLPNETAHFNIPKDRIVRQEHVIEKASDRTHVRCPIFYECGGCDFLHMTYESQLKMKQAYIQDLFVSNDVKVKVSPVMRSEQPFHYRHKVVLSATTSKKKLRLGLYRENSKQVIPFLDCFIQDKKVNDVMKTVEEVLNKYKIPAYDIDLESGIIKHVLIRKSHAEQTMLLVFVTHGNLLPNAKKMAQEIVKKHPLVQGVVQNIHNKKTRLVLL
ncbi:MAG: hypothetical protein IH571_01690, partial [Acholeplasmataceae bacterium]|nr:hypothetical protein [Acholeplasmataceae bacterium]